LGGGGDDDGARFRGLVGDKKRVPKKRSPGPGPKQKKNPTKTKNRSGARPLFQPGGRGGPKTRGISVFLLGAFQGATVRGGGVQKKQNPVGTRGQAPKIGGNGATRDSGLVGGEKRGSPKKKNKKPGEIFAPGRGPKKNPHPPRLGPPKAPWQPRGGRGRGPRGGNPGARKQGVGGISPGGQQDGQPAPPHRGGAVRLWEPSPIPRTPNPARPAPDQRRGLGRVGGLALMGTRWPAGSLDGIIRLLENLPQTFLD